MPCTRFVRRLSFATQSSSSLISSAVPLTARHYDNTSGFTQLTGFSPREDARDVVGDELRVVRFGVVGRAADVRRQHDVRHRDERMIGREVLALEVVEAGAAEVARLQRRDERVGVVQHRPRRC